MIENKAERIYLPIKGMNPDANGLSARPDECIDAKNVVITSDKVTQRDGTKYLGTKHENLFITGASYADANGNYIKQGTLVNGKPWYRRDGEPHISVSYSGTDWEIQDAFVEPDPVIYYHTDDTDTPPQDGWTANPEGAPNVPTVYTGQQPNEEIIEFWNYIHPEQGALLFAFCPNHIYQYNSSTYQWDDVSGDLPDDNNLEQWSVTNCVDRILGATCVAAGSKYTRPNENYTSGEANDRVLLYYDLTSGTFLDFETYKEVYVNETVGTTSSPVTTGNPYDISLSGTPGPEVVQGTAYVVLEGVGVIAYAAWRVTELAVDAGSNILSECNQFISVESGKISEADSWIRLSDGKAQIVIEADEIDGITTANRDITVYYTEKESVNYKPLYIHNFHEALIFANTVEAILVSESPDVYEWKHLPWRVRYSMQGNIQMFRERDYQELTIDDISPILELQSLETNASSNLYGPLYFYKYNSIVRGTYNQNFNLDPSFPVPMFTFEIAYSEGIEATRTIQNIEGAQFFLGRNDVYYFNGKQRVSLTHDSETGNTRVQDYIFKYIDRTRLHKCFAVYNDIQRKYFLFIIHETDVDNPTLCMVYDIDLNSWSRYVYPETSSGISADLFNGVTIDQLVGAIENLEGNIEDLVEIQDKQYILGMEGEVFTEHTGNTDKANSDGSGGEEFPSHIITRDFVAATVEEDDRVQKTFLEARYGQLEVGYSNYYAIDPAQVQEEGSDLNPRAFQQRETKQPSSEYYDRLEYNPDAVGYVIRYYIEIRDKLELRWIQSFSNQQEFTNI